jgi:hypothetical protein
LGSSLNAATAGGPPRCNEHQRRPQITRPESAFSPYAFDHAIDTADFTDAPGATGETEPICELCGAGIGIFLERGPTGFTTPATAQLVP